MNVPGASPEWPRRWGKEGVDLVASESANIEGTGTSAWGFFAEAHASVDVRKIRVLIEGSGPS